MTEESILKAVKIKLQHYKLLSATDDLFLERFNKFNELNDKLGDRDFKKEYIKYITAFNLNAPFWWEEAKEY